MSTNDGFGTTGNPNWREPNDRDPHEHDDNAIRDWSADGDEPATDLPLGEEQRDRASAWEAPATDPDAHIKGDDAANEETAAYDFGAPTEAFDAPTEPSDAATEPFDEVDEPVDEATEPFDEVDEPVDEATEPFDARTESENTPTEAFTTSTSEQPAYGGQEPRSYTGDLGAAPMGVAGDRGARPEPMPTQQGAAAPQATASDEGLVPSTAPHEKPSKRRTIIIVAIALVLILIAGAIWFFADRSAKAARGDELASDYNQQLEAYNSTWTPEAVSAVMDFDSTRLITPGNGDFFNTPQEVLDEVCPQVTAAQDALNSLSAAKMPTLGEANGADLSDSYKQAQATAAGLSAKQQAAEALVTNGPEKLKLATELCGNIGAYTTAYAQYVANYDSKMQPARTVANGSSITVDNIVFPCTNELGCMDVSSAEGRTAYADGVDASYTKFFTDLAALFRDQCVAAEFEPACSAAVANTEATAAKFRDSAQYLRTATPTFAVGVVPLADWEAMWNDAAASATQLRVDFVTGFQTLDPAVDSVDAMLQSVQNMLKTNQDELQALVDAVNA